MRVALVTPFFPSHGGGIENAAAALSEHLRRFPDIRIDWASSACDSPPYPDSNMHYHPLPANNSLEANTALPYPILSCAGYRRLAHIIDSSDILHIHDFIYPSNILAVCRAKQKNIPVVLTQHIGYIPYDNPILSGALELVNRTVGRKMLSSSDTVYFISNTVKTYFSTFCGEQPHFCYVPNGVDSKIFYPVLKTQRDMLRTELNIENGTLCALFVGRFVEKKGLSILRKLVLRLPFIHWIFAGYGPLNPSAWSARNITVFSNRRKHNLADLYRAADLLVLPSKGEGFPLVVQEAMACGTPILGSTEWIADDPTVEALCFHQPTLVRDAADRWHQQLKMLASSPELLTQLRPTVANFARDRWSWAVVAEHYYTTYTQLRNARHRNARAL